MSWIHVRHSEFYIRSVRGDNKDPLTKFLRDAGVPSEPEVNKPEQTTVFYFPIRAPVGSTTRADQTAIEQLELWKVYQEYWCEHKPSITVTVKENEWPAVGAKWLISKYEHLSYETNVIYNGKRCIMNKISYNESFGTFDEAQYFMEQRLSRHSNLYLDEAKLQYLNLRWVVGLLFTENQMELSF